MSGKQSLEEQANGVYDHAMSRSFPGDEYTHNKTPGYEAYAYNSFEILDLTYEDYQGMDTTKFDAIVRTAVFQMSISTAVPRATTAR